MPNLNRPRRLLSALAVMAASAFAAHAQSPRTLQGALALAYLNNPTIQAQRAALRATDEGVPTALAGWRPQIILSGSAAIIGGKTTTRSKQFGVTTVNGGSSDRATTLGSLTVTQPLYRGGRTKSETNRAVDQVLAGRAQLIATEQQVFTDTVNAFVNVISTQQVSQLDANDEQVLARQLQATQDRFRVGEITRTDVAQAEAALAQSRATRQTAEGNVQTARATFLRLVGEPPDQLIEPQPLRLPVRSRQEGDNLALANSPSVVQALFNVASAQDNFDIQYSALMPNLTLQGAVSRGENQQFPGTISQSGSVTANLTVPIYQGGSEYAAIRQARQQVQQARKQLDDARRNAISQSTSAWETYQAAKGTIESNRAAIRANQIALEGVQREAIVGSRTTLDVLNAEQALLNSRVTLVQSLANFVVASYSVASSVGRLTALDLNLGVPLYDEKAYYNAVKDRWIGTGDFATEQPGR